MEVKEKELRILNESWTRLESSSMVVEFRNWELVFSMPGKNCKISYRREQQIFMECPTLMDVYEILSWVDEAESDIEEKEREAITAIANRAYDLKAQA